MSWDNNNLACILVFPPWQKKGLGSILIGTSYEISRREGLLGGPEKPISELGKKGYGRFWGAEVARWLLECEVGVDTLMAKDEVVDEEEELDVEVIKVEKKPPVKKPSGKGMGKGWRKGMKGVGMQPQSLSQSSSQSKENSGPAPRLTPKATKSAPKLPVTPPMEDTCSATTVEAISKGTWIAADDVLGVLRSMGVLETVGGSNREKPGKMSASTLGGRIEKAGKKYKVKVDKEKIRKWVEKEGLSLEKCVREEGFAEGYGYAVSDVSGVSGEESLMESIEGSGEEVDEAGEEDELA